MHNTNTDYTQFAIVELVKTLINDPNLRTVENKRLDLRVEAYSLHGSQPACFGVFSHSSRQLQSLLTTSDNVLRRYTQLVKCLPVHERFALGFAGIMLNNMIEHDKYQADVEQDKPIIRDFYAFVSWIANAELNLNTDRALGCELFDVTTYVALSTLIQEFQQNADSCTDQQYFNFLGKACETFLSEFTNRYCNSDDWDHSWEIICRQIGVDLVAFSTFAPSAPIPQSQGMWLQTLVTPSSPNDADSNSFSLYCLSRSPTLDETHSFIKACDTKSPVKPDTLDFPSAFGLQGILLFLRTFATPFDVLQLLWNSLPYAEKTTYLSTVFEGLVLSFLIFGGPEIIPEKSVLRDSIQPVSSRALRNFRDFTLRNSPQHAWHAIQTTVYSVLAAPLHLINIGREIEAELNAGKTFTEALTDKRLSQLASTLKQHIRESLDARALAFATDSTTLTSLRTHYNALLTNIDNLQREPTGPNAYTALCDIYFEFSLAEAIQNRTHAQQMHEWESGELTVVTSFFPSLLTHELASFINNSLAQQRASTLIAASIATLGVVGAPYLKDVVDHINHSLTGKTLKAFATLQFGHIINKTLMGLLAFQALMLITSLPYGKNSLLMSLLKTLAQDPMKVALGFALLLGGANLLMSNITIDAVHELSCEARLSKTGLMMLPETCISELVETLHLASFPQLTEVIVMFKIAMYLYTLFSQNRHPTQKLAALIEASSLDDAELRQVKLHPELLQMITWCDLSKAYDPLGRAQVGAFIKAINAINKAESVTDGEKRTLTRQLYRHYMQSPKPVVANFMLETVCSMAFSLAYALPVVPTESLLNKRSLKWNIRSLGDAAKWSANLGILAGAYWWLFKFDRKHDGTLLSFFIAAVFGGDSHPAHTECVSHADCLSFHDHHLARNHSQLEELVEHCRLTITSCDCIPEGATQQTLDEIFHFVKLMTMGIIALAALKYWISWNSTLTQEARQQTKDYWKIIGSHSTQTLVDALFMLVYLIVAFPRGLFDLATMTSHYALGRCSSNVANTVSPTEHSASSPYTTLEEETENPQETEEAASSSTSEPSTQPRVGSALFNLMKSVASRVISQPLTTTARPVAYGLVNRLFAKSSQPDLGDLVMTVGQYNATNIDTPPAV